MDEASIPTLDQLKERIETELIPLAESIKFDGQSATQLVPILLYCAILESAWSTLLLSKHGMKMQAYLVLRSLVELVVEFEGIVEDEKRIRDFLIRSEKNVLKTLRRAKGGNPFFQKIGQLPDIDERIKAKEK